jgi:two-component system chemotaxis response regulator CheY
LVSKILVVDDEPDLRFILRRIFERAGHEVADAGNGLSALESVRQSTPHLVVTDMMMPLMSGAELIRHLRADPSTADIPILASTSNAEFAVGADVVLTKPWKSRHLLQAATALMSQTADRR